MHVTQVTSIDNQSIANAVPPRFNKQDPYLNKVSYEHSKHDIDRGAHYGHLPSLGRGGLTSKSRRSKAGERI